MENKWAAIFVLMAFVMIGVFCFKSWLYEDSDSPSLSPLPADITQTIAVLRPTAYVELKTFHQNLKSQDHLLREYYAIGQEYYILTDCISGFADQVYGTDRPFESVLEDYTARLIAQGYTQTEAGFENAHSRIEIMELTGSLTEKYPPYPFYYWITIHYFTEKECSRR